MPKGPSVEGTPTDVGVDDLLLDADNPRLASRPGEGPLSQEQIVKVMWSDMAVDEIALSIAANGFYHHEPLLVVPSERGKGPPYVVVEGNRRLAAVRLLREADLRAKTKATDLPELTDKDRAALDSLPVQVFPNRKVLWAYLG